MSQRIERITQGWKMEGWQEGRQEGEIRGRERGRKEEATRLFQNL